MRTLVLSLMVAASLPARAELPPLIPRKLLAGNPERASPRLSPDGKRLGWRAPDKNDVMQVWVKTIGKDDDKVVTADKKRGIPFFAWAWDDRHLLYLQDSDGDENYHVYSVDLADGAVRDLTPFQGIRANLEDLNPRFPNRMLVSMNLKSRELFDVYAVDLTTGALTLEVANPGDVAGWGTDDNMVVRAGYVQTPDGGSEIRVRANAKAKWTTLIKTGPEDEVFPSGFTKDGKSIYLTTSLGHDKSRLIAVDLATKKEREIAKHADADVNEVQVNPYTCAVEAVAFDPLRRVWTVIDPKVKGDFEGLAKVEEGDFDLVSRDRSDGKWVVAFVRDKGAIHWHVWDRKAQKATFLFAHQPKLDQLPLASVKAMTIATRDGLKLPAYLTLPVGVEAKKLPLVLMVHGGPWARDSWGFDSDGQLLANRGYAVLQVNFRGSTGFGKKFLHAADKQWGLTMHDDLVDAVKWAVADGVADPKRVAIYGGSYGGYAALAGAAFTPELFKCAVDVVGPSNLFTLIASVPPYWKPMMSLFLTRVGNPEKDKDLLTRASPLFSADKIRIPLLIGQGANDPRVKQAESEQIVGAIEKRGGRVTYVLYTDEGHGFQRPENNIDFTSRMEAFLAEQLGGRAEPLGADKAAGSTAVVKVVGKK